MNEIYDLAVIGGGINGAGVAQAAAAAGYRTVLLEKESLAAGTSSRSSKLIHGGLRYLEQGAVGMVREMLRERALLLKNAPDLVRLRDFNLPLYRVTRRRPWQVRTGLALYAMLGGGSFSQVPRRHWTSLDGLRLEGLQTVFRYRDAQTDDAALTRAVMASAISLGAEFQCPATLLGATVGTDTIVVRVQSGGHQFTLETRGLVNAAGPWVNLVLNRLLPAARPLPMELVQGAHIIVDAPAPSGVYALEASQDGRLVFAMPWHGRVLVGSTETLFHGRPEDVEPGPEEISYLIAVWHDYFPDRPGSLVGQFAGLRVLPAGSGPLFRRSRAAVLHGPNSTPPVLSVYGGKLTGYRATAEKAMQRLRPFLPTRKRVADTAALPLRPESGP